MALMASSEKPDRPKAQLEKCKQESESWFEKGREHMEELSTLQRARGCPFPQLPESLPAHSSEGLGLTSSSAKMCDLGVTM